jgi:uncharacterized membrane protein
MDRGIYTSLDARLRRLEQEAQALRTDLELFGDLGTRSRAADAAAAQPDAPRAAPLEAGPWLPARPPLPATAAQRKPRSFEDLVAGRGMQLAGILLVLLGTAFFLSLAFTRGWIGPVERIVLGLIAGAALVAVGGLRRSARDLPIAEGLIGLGAGILYLSLWAAVALYPQLGVSRGAAFAAMIAVTAVLVVLATTRRSERIALLGLAGGFLTPWLLAGGPVDRPVLAVYLFVLAAAFATIGVRARYRIVEAAAFVATMAYFGVFAPNATEGWSTVAACTVYTVFFGLFAVAFSAGARRDESASGARLALLAADTVLFAIALEGVFADSQVTLGIALLILAAVFIAAARVAALPQRMTLAYGYLGLAAATLALPALLHRTSLIDALALESALLVTLGANRADRYVQSAGAALFAVVGIALFFESTLDAPAGTAFSPLALAFVVTLGSLAFALTQLPRTVPRPGGVSWYGAGTVVASMVAVVGLARVLLDALGGQGWNLAVPSHAQVAISLAWTAYATALFGIGLRRGNHLLLRLGLMLFAVTILKVFIVDLSNVDLAWRIASFVGLGVVLVAVSAWYMRSQSPSNEAEA